MGLRDLAKRALNRALSGGAAPSSPPPARPAPEPPPAPGAAPAPAAAGAAPAPPAPAAARPSPKPAPAPLPDATAETGRSDKPWFLQDADDVDGWDETNPGAEPGQKNLRDK